MNTFSEDAVVHSEHDESTQITQRPYFIFLSFSHLLRQPLLVFVMTPTAQNDHRALSGFYVVPSGVSSSPVAQLSVYAASTDVHGVVNVGIKYAALTVVGIRHVPRPLQAEHV